ncbi:hypothetical protein B484DRAFT_428090, partial [Ochromonadaceae sp. CCMP2298]
MGRGTKRKAAGRNKGGKERKGTEATADQSQGAMDVSAVSVESASSVSPAGRRTRLNYEGSQFQLEDERIAQEELARVATIAQEKLARVAAKEAARIEMLKVPTCMDVRAGYLTKGAAAALLGMKFGTFKDMYNRWVLKGYVAHVGHNPAILDEIGEQDLEIECGSRSIEGAGWRTVVQFRKVIEPFWRATLQRRGDKRYRELTCEISASSVRERMAKYIPEFMRMADKQNLARFCARVNFLAAITSAAVSFSVLQGENGGLYPDDPTAIMPALIFNTDELSTDLNPTFEKDPIRVAAGTGKALRGENFGVKGVTGVLLETFQEAYSTPEAIEKSDLAASTTLSTATPAAKTKTHPQAGKPISSWTKKRRYYGDSFAHRGVSVDFTTSGDGQLVQMTATFQDDSLPPGSFYIYPLQTVLPGEVYMILRHPKVDQEKLSVKKLKNILYPACARFRDRVVLGQEDIAKLMRNLARLQAQNQGTALYQQNDVSCGHKVFHGFVKCEKDIICEGNEGSLPTYMRAVHNILVGHQFPASLYRTIFKQMANFPHWSHAAMNRHNLLQGYRLTGFVPWSLDAFLRRWSGSKVLEKRDFERIRDAFPHLVEIAHVTGVIYDEYAKEQLGDFLNEVHEKGLSKLALAVIANHEKTKRDEDRPLNQGGATHLDNAGLLDKRREWCEVAEAKELLKQGERDAVLKLDALRVCVGQLLSPEADRMLKGVTLKRLREKIYVPYKMLSEKDYLKLRGVCKAFAKVFAPCERYTPKFSKGIAAMRTTASATAANTAAIAYLAQRSAGIEAEALGQAWAQLQEGEVQEGE